MPSDGSRDIYFSADVESDGPVPGSFSMLSFALVAVATFDGEHFVRLDPHEVARYWELQPISERFDPEALSINGLDRERLRREGALDDAIEQGELFGNIFEWALRRLPSYSPS
jgi:hypothetical protein